MIEDRLLELVTAIGQDVMQITDSIGGLGNLNTTDKSSVAAALNEVQADLEAKLNITPE